MRNRRCSRQIPLVFCLMSVVCLFNAERGGAQSDDVYILVLRVDVVNELKSSAPDPSIEDVVNGLLPRMIEETAFKQRRAYFVARQSRERPPWDRDKYNDLVARSKEQGVDYLILPQLKLRDRGSALKVATIGLKHDTARAYFLWRNEIDLDSAAIAGGGDFSDIEGKIFEVAMSITGRILRGRVLGSDSGPGSDLEFVRTFLFWCVTAAEKKDSRLDWLSRRLTLRMPYYLSIAAEKKELYYSFIGLSPREYQAECVTPGFKTWSDTGPYGSIKQADAIISADVVRKADEFHVSMMVYFSRTRKIEPLTDIILGSEESNALEKMSDATLSAIVQRLSSIRVTPIYANYAVIQHAYVWNAPSAASEKVGSLTPGSDVLVTAKVRDTGWLKIQMSSGRVGYVQSRFLDLSN